MYNVQLLKITASVLQQRILIKRGTKLATLDKYDIGRYDLQNLDTSSSSFTSNGTEQGKHSLSRFILSNRYSLVSFRGHIWCLISRGTTGLTFPVHIYCSRRCYKWELSTSLYSSNLDPDPRETFSFKSLFMQRCACFEIGLKELPCPWRNNVCASMGWQAMNLWKVCALDGGRQTLISQSIALLLKLFSLIKIEERKSSQKKDCQSGWRILTPWSPV
jgi:hypothetical protein